MLHKKFTQTYVDENGNLVDELAIKTRVCRLIATKPAIVSDIILTYVKSLMCTDALSLAYGVIGMSSSEGHTKLDSFFEYHPNHMQVAFEE